MVIGYDIIQGNGGQSKLGEPEKLSLNKQFGQQQRGVRKGTLGRQISAKRSWATARIVKYTPKGTGMHECKD